MTSKIINMVDRTKDAEDRLLESIFAAEPIADDGFSNRIVRRIRRQIWIRRLALPTAMLVGGVIAIKPALHLVTAGSRLLSAVPPELLTTPAGWVPQLPVMLLGGALLVIGMLGTRMID